MKTLTEVLLLAGLLVVAYLSWLNQQQIMELAASQLALEAKVGTLTVKPAAAKRTTSARGKGAQS